MAADMGKREAHKLATRTAIQSAADTLFATTGYANTTVKDIADAAGVTERTFFRYFPDKEALLVVDIEARLTMVGVAIADRPPNEPPLVALESAFVAQADRMRETRSNLVWLFQDGPPGPKLAKSTPGLLLALEQVIADALTQRLRSPGPTWTDDEFEVQVLARCAVAALRSAGIRHWQLAQLDNGGPRPTVAELLVQAFAVMRRGFSEAP